MGGLIDWKYETYKILRLILRDLEGAENVLIKDSCKGQCGVGLFDHESLHYDLTQMDRVFEEVINFI